MVLCLLHRSSVFSALCVCLIMTRTAPPSAEPEQREARVGTQNECCKTVRLRPPHRHPERETQDSSLITFKLRAQKKVQVRERYGEPLGSIYIYFLSSFYFYKMYSL